ncbi:MAG: DUF5635 domain-containing protein [Gordonia sp. (in: high G+C Gram-positive bacteria)]|uniref:DUF5635 domain-containing protein n=1 Tax=Gordonia sp. (in: high G+C Gram-positive bacteria) TaxID=84139 RepID=UPI0039E4BA26
MLSTASDGRLTSTAETQSVGFHEEAGRRYGRELDAGLPSNQIAAVALADEVACMANSPGGGALIVGVEDRTGRIIGTELDGDWLRDSVLGRIGVAPDIREERAEGLRLLTVFVAEAREPVEDTDGGLRWRVGGSSRPVDRSEWWEHRDRAERADPMAAPSPQGPDTVRPGAMEIVRRLLDADTAADEEVLRRLGAVRSDGLLTRAGALLLTRADRTLLDFTESDVPDGPLVNRISAAPEGSLLEQLMQIEFAVRVANTMAAAGHGARRESVRRVPEPAVREALLNGVIHRDWNRPEPTEVRWSDLESTLTVVSPGGFPDGITTSNVVSGRTARHPALADLFRALGLVDKPGAGVDRMYREMLVVGHRPPEITEEPGVRVLCTLTGGRPVYPVMECVRAVAPAERRNDYRIAIILHRLMHRAFVTTTQIEEALQSSAEAARIAVEAARQTAVRSGPLIVGYKDSWILGPTARALLAAAHDPDGDSPVMAYLSTDLDAQAVVACDWVDAFGSVTTGDLDVLTGTSRGTVKRTLDALVARGDLVSLGAGRSARYERP